jgi:cation:H+ antiporter
MLIAMLLLVAGLAVLLVGAEWLVRGSSRLAFYLGISPLIIGLTVVSFGTSAPELATCLFSAHHGRGDIALGNIIGSNIANIGLILGLAGLLTPIRVDDALNTRLLPFLLVVSAVLFWFSRSLEISRIEGLVLLALFVLYIWYCLKAARLGTRSPKVSAGLTDREPATTRGDEEKPADGGSSLFKNISLVIIGLIMLGVGAELLIRGAVEFALLVGISEAVAGVTVVALGTSLPELVASVLAAVRKMPGMALGNIVGSNIFNVLAIAGTSASVFPFAVSAGLVNTSMPVMMGFTVLLLVFCFSRGTVSRLEGGVLVLCTALYVAGLLYFP